MYEQTCGYVYTCRNTGVYKLMKSTERLTLSFQETTCLEQNQNH